jgi:hypothetical protein
MCSVLTGKLCSRDGKTSSNLYHRRVFLVILNGSQKKNLNKYYIYNIVKVSIRYDKTWEYLERI